jgi:cobalt-zinc-cadmium efflux system membrane fusion protein
MKVAVLLAFLLIVLSCGRSAPPASTPKAEAAPASSTSQRIEIPPDSPRLKQIQVAQVKAVSMPTDEFTAPGKLETNPNRVSKVLLPVPGRVTQVMVRFGDAVRRDDPMLAVESPEADSAASAAMQAEAQIIDATAALHKAQVDLDRITELFKGDAIAKKEMISAETTVAQAKTALTQAQTAQKQAAARLEQLGLVPGAFRQKIIVRAPLSGKITEINVVSGEFRNDLSAPLITIADLSTVWVSSEVPESAIRLVKTGEVFDVTLAAFPGEVYHSRVTRIADSVDPQTRTVKVWAELANASGRLRPEMFGEVRHIEAYHVVPVVPAQAVVQLQGKAIVYREAGAGKFDAVTVETGKASGGLLPVTRGLAEGDRVVVDGAMLLRGYQL